MFLIVGLGNPGPKYQFNRHNIGFMVVDGLARSFSDGQFKAEHKALVTKIRMGSTPALLAKPQTYMNLSGESTQALCSYYDIDKDKILVIHDEVDLPFGEMKYQKKRGHGGHNGVRDINKNLGGNDYARLRLGISRPPNDRMAVADYCLSDFSKDEMKTLPDLLSLACESVEAFVRDGFEYAANNYNQKGLLQ